MILRSILWNISVVPCPWHNAQCLPAALLCRVCPVTGVLLGRGVLCRCLCLRL